MSLIVPNSERSKAAFGTPLVCGYQVMRAGEMTECGGTRWTFLEDIGPFRKRYRCKDCKRVTQYDYSARATHPYAPLVKQPLFRRIVEGWAIRNPKHDGGRTPLAAKSKAKT